MRLVKSIILRLAERVLALPHEGNLNLSPDDPDLEDLTILCGGRTILPSREGVIHVLYEGGTRVGRAIMEPAVHVHIADLRGCAC